MVREALFPLLEKARRFVVRSDGSLSVETAIILPALLYIYVGSFVWFDAFRMQNVNLNATYTIGDMISREHNGVDQDYFDGMDLMYDYLTKGIHPTQLRVSVIECVNNCDSTDSRELAVCWSAASPGRAELSDSGLQALEKHVPLFHWADQYIMTESFMIYNPAFNVGLKAQLLENVVFTRPRQGQVKWDNGDGTYLDCNNNN